MASGRLNCERRSDFDFLAAPLHQFSLLFDLSSLVGQLLSAKARVFRGAVVLGKALHSLECMHDCTHTQRGCIFNIDRGSDTTIYQAFETAFLSPQLSCLSAAAFNNQITQNRSLTDNARIELVLSM